MKRQEILGRLGYHIPKNKMKRVIISSDIAAEADDQFAIAHHLLTPSEDVVGIVASHFEWRFRTIPQLQDQRLQSMEKCYAEGEKILRLMEIDDVPIYKGAKDQITDKEKPPLSEGSEFIIKEAMKDSDDPLYIALQGASTDLAAAYLAEPKIAERIEAAIMIGGGAYPAGGTETNIRNDIYAAQVLFESPIKIWQIPINVYSGIYVSLSELITKIKPAGKIGGYLCERMFEVNDWYGQAPRGIPFPHGEVWSLGDQPTVTVLLQNAYGAGDYNDISSERKNRQHIQKAPHINDDMSYSPNPQGKDIIVHDVIDNRLTMDDLFAKLELCYGRLNT
jgi:hypothetical protein